MARNQQDSRIPVFRSGIPLAFGGPRVRPTTQLPVRAGTRPTALSGLTAHWPSSSDRQPSPVSSSSSPSSPSDSSAVPNSRIPPDPGLLPAEITGAHLGHEVVVGGTKAGILRYFGTIPFDTGLFCGVELHKAEGLNDGSVKGIRLFYCKPQHGVLAPLRKVSLLLPGKTSGLSPLLLSSSSSPSPPPLPPPAAVVPSESQVPSGVKRQRTNAYEAKSTAAAPEEDEVSTRKVEDVAGEVSTDERWSSEEATPPAEQTELPASLLCSRVSGDKREASTEDNEKNSIPISLSSVPSPNNQRTFQRTLSKTSEGSHVSSSGSSIVAQNPRKLRSISDGSISEMSGTVSTSTPVTSTTSGPLASRCVRRGHGGNNNNNSAVSRQQQQQHCSNDCVFAAMQRNSEEGCGIQHGCDTCACGRAISKHSSFELDESLGILTPDQMVDFTVCMEGYCRTPSTDERKWFIDEDAPVFPSSQDPFGRNPPGNESRKRFSVEEAVGFPEVDGFFDEELEAIGSTSPKSESQSPSPEELAAKAEVDRKEVEEEEVEAMEGGEEDAREELDGHSDVDEEVEARMEDEDEEEVKDVMGEPCASLMANVASDTTETPASITGAAPPRPTQVAPCFVASVTSITSIDPGYQGDGEWSRPASRAENSPGSSAPQGIGVNVGLSVDVLKLKFDTMTDSDFYSDTGAGGTESDADHEEAVREGAMAVGDRRAQVIDGTLYGGIPSGQHGGVGGQQQQHGQQAPPRCFAAVMTSSTATTTEEMESSGVFSDLDRRTDLRISFHSQTLPRPSSAQGVSSSAAESSDVPQSPLEELPEDPKKDVTFSPAGEAKDGGEEDSEDGAEMRVENEETLLGEKMDTSSSPAEVAEEFSMLGKQEATFSMSCDASPNQTVMNATPMSPSPRLAQPPGNKEQQQGQQQQMQQPQQQNQQEQQANGQQEQQQSAHSPRQKSSGSTVNVSPPKKHKMPKRNVASKIKAMIESSSTKEAEGSREDAGDGGSARRQPRNQNQRPGRWDAIMSKIAAGQAEQRTSRPRLREVKSRVMAGLSTPTNASRNSTTNEDGGTENGSVRAKKTFISNATRARRGETRRARARALDISSLRDATCAANPSAPSGGVGDSLNPSVHSSMSDVSVSRGATAKTSAPSRSSKKREADRSASPFSDGSSNSGASNIPRPMRPHLGAIPRQPSHPQRERVRDKTSNINALTMASSSPSAAVPRRNQRTSHLTSSSSATPSPKRLNTGHRRTQTAEKGTATEMKAPSARKPITRHLSSSTAQVQKPAPLRDNNRLGGGVLSKNGGPATNHSNNNSRGNTVVLLQRQHVQTAAAAAVEAPAPEAVVETTVKSPPPKGPPPIPSKLLDELKHSAAGIEALGVLIQYLVVDLDAFSTPCLKKAVESYKTEAINTKLSLDEALASCQRLAEAAEISEVRHKENVDELIRKKEESFAELDARLTSQVEETQCRYEEELKRRDRLNNRNMEALLEDLKLYVERSEKAEKKTECTDKRVNDLEKEKQEILARENDFKQLNSQLQREVNDLVEKLRKEDLIKAGDCSMHRDEIQSLQAVLDLRTKELHDHRKKTEEYRQKSEALNSALARNAALQARVEDVEAQLQRKVATERKLQERVRHLSENVERECRHNEQLALENEVLEWKINESSKLMASFSGQSDMSSSMTGSMMASSSPSSDRRSVSNMAISLGSPESPPTFMFPRFSPRLSPKSPFSDVSGTIELEEDEEEDMDGDEEEDEEEEIIKVEAEGAEEDEEEDEEDEEEGKLSIEPTPITPKVRTLVKKNESISWLVEMEEVIPASSLSSHIQSMSMRRSHHSTSVPLNLLPQMMSELPATNSPSNSPTSSNQSGNMFRGGKGGPHSSRKVSTQVAKKMRPERGKGGGHGMMYTSTPGHLTSSTHGHHHHHARYHHQPRSMSRLPPTDSPMGSARSRSVSTDSESLDAEEASAVANARIAELKAWRSGKSFAAPSEERIPVLNVSIEGNQKEGKSEEQENKKSDGKSECSGEKGEWEVNGGSEIDLKFADDNDSRVIEDGCIANGSPTGKPSTPLGDRDSPKDGSSFCEFSEDFSSDQSPFHGKFEVNGTSLNPMEDSSSSIENVLEAPKKQTPPPTPPSSAQAPFHHPPVKQGITMVDAPPSMMHQMHHHYQPRHVLSSLCAHPHLSIKESAGEAMISEEISDDTQGESEDEDRRAEGKSSDSEDEVVGGIQEGAAPQCHNGGNEELATPSVEQNRGVSDDHQNGEDLKCSTPQEEPVANNNLKLGQQLLSSSTPDSSHFAHTDSSVMDISWSEDLDLVLSESEAREFGAVN